MSTPFPRNNVSYRIQNLDFGTFISIVDDFPLDRAGTRRKAKLVVRPRKEGIHTQEWIFHALGNDTWAISNQGATFAIDNTPAATFINKARNAVPNIPWTIGQENDTNIVKISTAAGFLRSTTGFDDTDEDKVKWRLVEVCPIFGQVESKFRLRGLSGRLLYDSIHTLPLGHEWKLWTPVTLWEIEPAADGKCIIKADGGGDNDYISCHSVIVDEQPNWVVVKGPRFAWDIDYIAGFAYQIIKPGGDIRLALTIGKDNSNGYQDILLKPNKITHNQIWLIERQ